jgi:hypothetical protein
VLQAGFFEDGGYDEDELRQWFWFIVMVMAEDACCISCASHHY